MSEACEAPGWRFAVTSCAYPAGFFDRAPARAAAERLASESPAFVLSVGDQVYVDASAGVFDPRTLTDRFRFAYARFGEPHSAMATVRDHANAKSIPRFPLLDDHEIDDNWEPAPDGRPDPLLNEAIRWFEREQLRDYALGSAARFFPPSGDAPRPLWYTLGPVDGWPRVFVADTRTERTPRTAATVTRARIMSETQFDALCDWLRECPPGLPKVIACPALPLPRHRCAAGDPVHALRSDAWDGYPYSLHRLLAFIAREGIRHVIFVSGDEHLPCAASVDLAPEEGAGAPIRLVSLHAPPLYAPFPFANAVPEDLDDSPFCFVDPDRPQDRFRCRIDVAFPVPTPASAGPNGLLVVGAQKTGAGWRVHAHYLFGNTTDFRVSYDV